MTTDNNDIGELKTLYDELWQDARTLVKDMNRSIWVYLFGGIMTLLMAFISVVTTLSNILLVLGGEARTLEYIYAAGGLIGTLVMAYVGIYLLVWYFRLKKRYSRLLEMEKKLGD